MRVFFICEWVLNLLYQSIILDIIHLLTWLRKFLYFLFLCFWGWVWRFNHFFRILSVRDTNSDNWKSAKGRFLFETKVCIRDVIIHFWFSCSAILIVKLRAVFVWSFFNGMVFDALWALLLRDVRNVLHDSNIFIGW